MYDNNRKPVSLVINADDFGYFTSVSRGIIECARKGAIHATAVMANGPRFHKLVKWLHDVPNIDLGVHLNITYGLPVSKECRRLLATSGGTFKSKIATAAMLITKKMSYADVKAEWCTQIDKCLSAGLKLRYLNSHEHTHIVPIISGLLPELADEYGISFIRQPSPDWIHRPITLSTLLRNLLIGLTVVSSPSHQSMHNIRVLGIGVSGKLTLKYLERCFSSLTPGETYELMCHPGAYDPDEITDKRLKGFHAWDQERELLMSENMMRLMQYYNLKSTRFSEL
jgi:predicted glycoside hydrolase/deacetylase ChbG (UPF0249 family)